jgi:hypothetical protein
MMTGFGVQHRSESMFSFGPEWAFTMGRNTHPYTPKAGATVGHDFTTGDNARPTGSKHDLAGRAEVIGEPECGSVPVLHGW